MSMNRFLSLTLSHNYSCYNAFTLAPPPSFLFALQVPRLLPLRFALSDLACPRPLSALLCSPLCMLGRRRRPTHGTPVGQGMPGRIHGSLGVVIDMENAWLSWGGVGGWRGDRRKVWRNCPRFLFLRRVCRVKGFRGVLSWEFRLRIRLRKRCYCTFCCEVRLRRWLCRCCKVGFRLRLRGVAIFRECM